jgi:hypothetical protein
MIDEIALLRESDDAFPDLDEVRLEAIRASLDDAIAQEQSAAESHSSHRHRSWFIGAAAAAVVAAIALPVALFGGSAPRSGSHIGQTNTVETILARLADVAIAQPATVPPGQGQFQYTASIEANQSCGESPSSLSSYCALVPEQRQIWIGSDGSGRILETFGTPEFLAPAEQAAWVAAGSPPLGNGTSDTSFGPNSLSDGPSSLANAPTDPTALKTAIEDRSLEGGPPGSAEDFTQIGDLLRETDASPALRSAVFQVASELPGIVLLGSVADHDGRSGVGLAMDLNGVRNELVFDVSTSALMGEQSVALVDGPDGYQGVTAGTVLGWTVYESSGIVNSISVTPSGTAPSAPPVTCRAAPAGTGLVPAPGTINGSMPAAIHCTTAR